jgi:YVTN family beta-propeller protein
VKGYARWSSVVSATTSTSAKCAGFWKYGSRAPPAPSDGLVARDALVWIPNRNDNTISLVDPTTNAVRATIRSGAGPLVLNVGFGDVWAASWNGSGVWRIRPAPIAGP